MSAAVPSFDALVADRITMCNALTLIRGQIKSTRELMIEGHMDNAVFMLGRAQDNAEQALRGRPAPDIAALVSALRAALVAERARSRTEFDADGWIAHQEMVRSADEALRAVGVV